MTTRTATPLHERLRRLIPEDVLKKVPEQMKPPAWRDPAPSWAQGGDGIRYVPGARGRIKAKTHALADAKGKPVPSTVWLKPGEEGDIVGLGPDFVVFRRANGDAYQVYRYAVEPIGAVKWASRREAMAEIKAPDGQQLYVWRVEDAQGRGPHVAGGMRSVDDEYDGMQAWRMRPVPVDDFSREDAAAGGFEYVRDGFMRDLKQTEESKNKLFGFMAKEDAEKWFGPRTLKALHEQGFQLKRVPARRAWLSQSRRQVFFEPMSSRTAEDMAPVETFEWRGLPVCIEAAGGDTRHADQRYPQHLPEGWVGMGYIKDVPTFDGDSLDVIIGGAVDESGAIKDDEIYIATQTSPEGDFTQFKVMFGFESEAAAQAGFLLLWPRKMFGDIVTVPRDYFLDTLVERFTVEAQIKPRDAQLEVTQLPRYFTSKPWNLQRNWNAVLSWLNREEPSIFKDVVGRVMGITSLVDLYEAQYDMDDFFEKLDVVEAELNDRFPELQGRYSNGPDASSSEMLGWAAFDYMKFVLGNTWLVHFTNAGRSIVEEGFTRGVDDPDLLPLTTHLPEDDKDNGGFVFAFEVAGFNAEKASLYGEDVVMFFAPGVKAYHRYDGDVQVIVWGPSIPTTHMVLIEKTDPGPYGVVARRRDAKRDYVYRGELESCVEWVMNNFTQYRRQITAMPLPAGLPEGWQLQWHEDARRNWLGGKGRLEAKVLDEDGFEVAVARAMQTADKNVWQLVWVKTHQGGWGSYAVSEIMSKLSARGAFLQSDTSVSESHEKFWQKSFDDASLERREVGPRSVYRNWLDKDAPDAVGKQKITNAPWLDYAYRRRGQREQTTPPSVMTIYVGRNEPDLTAKSFGVSSTPFGEMLIGDLFYADAATKSPFVYELLWTGRLYEGEFTQRGVGEWRFEVDGVVYQTYEGSSSWPAYYERELAAHDFVSQSAPRDATELLVRITEARESGEVDPLLLDALEERVRSAPVDEVFEVIDLDQIADVLRLAGYDGAVLPRTDTVAVGVWNLGDLDVANVFDTNSRQAGIAGGRDIVVTIPKSQVEAVEAEESDVAARLADGETDIEFYWQMGRLPSEQPRRIYFVWDGAVRAYHEVTGMDRAQNRVLMNPTIVPVEPVPYPSFRGFRYYNDNRTAALPELALATALLSSPMEDRKVHRPVVVEVAQEVGVDPALLDALVWEESKYNHDATSSVGARGLLQLMPSSWKSLDAAEPQNVREHVSVGARYLKKLIDLFKGDLELALAAYNAGPRKVREAGGVPEYTRAFVDRVLARAQRYRKRGEHHEAGPVDKLKQFLQSDQINFRDNWAAVRQWAYDTDDETWPRILSRVSIAPEDFENFQGDEFAPDFDTLCDQIEQRMTAAEKRSFAAWMVKDDPGSAPSWATLKKPEYILGDTWLVHFSPYASSIVEQGFTRGVPTPDNIAFTGYLPEEQLDKGGYTFAFTVEGAKAYLHRHGSGASDSFVMFFAPGVQAYHTSDRDSQVIVWGPDVPTQNMVLVEHDVFGKWEVRSRSGAAREVLYSTKNVDKVFDWVETNFAQYRRQLTARVAAKIYDSDEAPMYVWRVENEQGIGPYRMYLPDMGIAYDGDESVVSAHPYPHEDFSEKEQKERHGKLYGFATEQDAIRWFSNAGLESMRPFGFQLKRVPARRVWKSQSGRQVFFEPWEERTASLWENVRKKRERGERPAKPGEDDYPDEKTWKKLTAAEWDEDYGQQNAYARDFEVRRVPLSQLASPFMNPVSDARVEELAELTDAGYELPPVVVNGPDEVEETDYPHEKYPFLDGHEPVVGEEVWWLHDGHHRATLALQRGEKFIDAAIIGTTRSS